MEQQPMLQQAPAGDQDEASWSLYDFAEINNEFHHREDNIIHGNITSISLYDKPREKDEYTDEDWKRIGIALSECIKLKKLDLVGVKLKKSIVKCIFQNRGQHSWPDFGVVRANQGVMGLRALLPALKSFASLDTLDLSCCWKLGIQGAKLIGSLLNETKISNLVLGCEGNHRCNLEDDGLKCILEASNAKHLIRMRVGGGYTQAGYDALSTFLRRDDIQLRILGVKIEYGYRPDTLCKEDIECMFIDSIQIQNKSKLEIVTISCWYDGVKGPVKEKLTNLVCNTESIQSLLVSNHKFCSLDYSGWGNSHVDNQLDTVRNYRALRGDKCKDLSHAFEINMEVAAGGCIARAVRRKVRSFYFQQPEFDVTSFVDMDANLLPYVLDLVTRIECRDVNWLDSRLSNKKEPFLVPSYNNLNGIYRLVKNCPVALFSFPSPHDLLKEKDDVIMQLKAANETMRLQLEEQAREIEILKKGGPTPSNKRAKTGDDKAKSGGDIESRLAALEADVALLKQK